MSELPCDPRELRRELRRRLEAYGYRVGEDWTLAFADAPRAVLARQARRFHGACEAGGVERHFAAPSEVDPLRMRPVLWPVDGRREGRIFRCVRSFWSAPTSLGFGRRMRFLLWDDANGKVMGVLGLTDPVVGLGVRDRHIGWSKEERTRRLYHVMSAHLLGAIPPYNRFRVAKLVALLAGSEVVREHFRERYGGRPSALLGAVRPPILAMVDAMGAFGKSAIYTRLRGWRFVGYTRGNSHFHLVVEDVYAVFLRALECAGEEAVLRRNRFGHGPNWRIRVLRRGAEVMGVPFRRLLAHGLPRGYYVYPLLRNWKAFLRGEDERVEPLPLEGGALIAYWRARWLYPYLYRRALLSP